MNHTGSNPPNNPEIKAVAIIPARYDSVRLPGKALLEIAGKPMICWVVERSLAARHVSRVIVATDDERILNAVTAAGYEGVMTRANHKTGTDRIAEVAASLDDAEIIVNVQGDEPLISPQTIDRAVAAMGEGGRGKAEEDSLADAESGRRGEAEIGIVTTWEPMESAVDVLNPDVVKVVVDSEQRAVYFSRCPVPYPRDAVRLHGSLEVAFENEPTLLDGFRKHTGLYVYRRKVLIAFTSWTQSELELTESLEQLRALEHGVRIKVIEAGTSSIAVDTNEDLQRVRALVEQEILRLGRGPAVQSSSFSLPSGKGAN